MAERYKAKMAQHHTWRVQSKTWQKASLFALGLLACCTYAQAAPLAAVPEVKIDQYLGAWYEVARKPMYFQRKCAKDVVARYTLNENGNIGVDNSCVTKGGQRIRSLGEAFVQNPPANSQLKVSFLPEFVRWIPIARGNYWIIKLDPEYQMALVAEPTRRYMWVLSRSSDPDPKQVAEYLDYAASVGYDLSDLIRTKHSQP